MVDNDTIIAKLAHGGALNDEEQAFINAKLEKARKIEEQTRKAQAIMNLNLKYARAHYTPTDDEVNNEIARLASLRK